ncbi:MAG TPA: hypothetical protein VIU61_14800 [Kofleriaceae bacterium]
MTAVLIALADVGPGVQLEEQLVAANVPAKWDAAAANGPRDTTPFTVVLIDADLLGERLAGVADRWRDHAAMPGIVAIGSSAAAREHAPKARVTLVAPTAKLATVITAIREAAKLRLSATMRWDTLRAALGLTPVTDAPTAWQPTLTAARTIDIEIPRAALRWHAGHYATPTHRLDELREDRVLTVPELEAASVLDGTRTVQTHVKAGPLDPMQTARFLWTLASIGALDFTPEIRDVATSPRRLLAELRAHLRARARRLEKSTYYDVLEITPLAEYPEIEKAYQLVGARFAPSTLAGHDVSDLTTTIQPMWDLVEKARSVLVDHAQRGRYHDWLRQKLPELRTVWAIDPKAIGVAAEAFVRGQRLLGEGDVHRAMSELAMACRQFPGHPDYEANLAWARYRVQVASGRDRIEAAVTERKTIEELLLGCKPWPRALVALALLCAAGGDADSARWHLHTALTVDPTVPAAAQLAQRLGMRR